MRVQLSTDRISLNGVVQSPGEVVDIDPGQARRLIYLGLARLPESEVSEKESVQPHDTVPGDPAPVDPRRRRLDAKTRVKDEDQA